MGVYLTANRYALICFRDRILHLSDPKNTGLWQELRNAIRGTEADYTQIGLKRAILLLAVPMILELVMESTFAVVDIYFVGQLGASAVATVGLTETYLFLLYSLAMGLATAVTATIARRIGESNMRMPVLPRCSLYFWHCSYHCRLQLPEFFTLMCCWGGWVPTTGS
jgi:hypothetical protein